MNVDEVPDTRDADRVSVPRCRHDRRDVSSIIFGGPKAVARDFDRRKADPFAPRRAVVIEIKSGMIHQDRQPAANEHHHKEEVEEMTVTHPQRKSVRSGKVARRSLRNLGNGGQAGYRELDPCGGEYRQHRDGNAKKNGRSNPDTKAAILWIVHSAMCDIKRNHKEIDTCVFAIQSDTA